MYKKDKVSALVKYHYIRGNLLQIWNKYKKYLTDRKPLWIIPEEVVHFIAGGKRKKPLSYRDLIKFEGRQATLKSEVEMEFKYDWWSYQQIKDLFMEDKKECDFREQLTDLETILVGDDIKVISKIYKTLLRWFTMDEQVKEQMIKWALSVNSEIEMDHWEYLWRRSIRISSCIAIQENCYKLFYRWYMTPKKLAKIFKNSSNSWRKCEHSEGSFYHLWWSCKEVNKYWTSIHKKIQKILKGKIPKRPELFLLGISFKQINKF